MFEDETGLDSARGVPLHRTLREQAPEHATGELDKPRTVAMIVVDAVRIVALIAYGNIIG